MHPHLSRLRHELGALSRNPAFRNQVIVAVLALAAFELVLDVRILPPTSIDWIFSFDTDLAQYYMGFAFFRFSDWHFPLGQMETMLHPVGASLTLIDGIPLLGIPFKLVDGILPRDFQYLGVWLLTCVWLNGVFAHRLLTRLVESVPLRWAGTVLVMLAPPLVGRFGHCGLSAHWLILASFEAVLLDRLAPKRIWFLAGISLFIHSYLFAMLTPLLLAAVFRHRAERRQVLVTLAGWALTVVCSAWALGYFGLKATQGGNADHYYGDLFSFFNTTGVASIVPATRLAGHLGRMRPGTPEGFAYLGLGGLVLLVALVAALAARVRPRGTTPSLHPAAAVLGVACLLLFGYAISPSPFILGERHDGIVALTELLRPITTRLRAPGRFTWPLFYFVLIFGMQAAERWLTRLHRPRATVAGAALLVAAQAADVGAWLYQTGRDSAFSEPRRLRQVSSRVTKSITKHTKLMVFDPPVQRRGCPGKGMPWEKDFHSFYPLALLAARSRLTVNTDFRGSARLASSDFDAVCKYTRWIVEAKPPDVVVVTPNDVRERSRR